MELGRSGCFSGPAMDELCRTSTHLDCYDRMYKLSDLYSKQALWLTVPWLEDSNSMVPAFW